MPEYPRCSPSGIRIPQSCLTVWSPDWCPMRSAGQSGIKVVRTTVKACFIWRKPKRSSRVGAKCGDKAIFPITSCSSRHTRMEATLQDLPGIWEAQAAVPAAIPNTGYTVINDIGNIRDIHPRNKQDVGLRLANQALNRTYGRSEITWAGPVYRSFAIEGQTVRVTFDHAEGLKTRDGQPPESPGLRYAGRTAGSSRLTPRSTERA